MNYSVTVYSKIYIYTLAKIMWGEGSSLFLSIAMTIILVTELHVM